MFLQIVTPIIPGCSLLRVILNEPKVFYINIQLIYVLNVKIDYLVVTWYT